MRFPRDRGGHCWQAVLDGRAGPEAEAHLAACAACATRVAAVRARAAAVRDALGEPAAGLDARVLAAAARARRPDAVADGRRLATPARVRLLAVTAVAALVVVLGLLPGPVLDPPAARAVPVSPLSAACPTGLEAGVLEVAGVWHGEEARQFARVLAGFQERTGVRVRFTYETRAIASKLKARLQRGCPPAVALLPQPGLMADLVRAGRLQPLDRGTAALVRRNYAPAWQRLGSVGGRLYGVWFKAADKSTVWYRPDAFRRAGIALPPATWGQLIDAARKLRAAGIDPVAVGGADGWTLTDWFENVYLGLNGPARYDALAAHRIPWTDPSVAAALRRMAQLLGDTSLAGTPERMLETTFEQSVADVFAHRRGAAGMVYEGDFVRSFLPASGRAAGGAPARYFPFPGEEGPDGRRSVVGGDVAVLLQGSRDAARLIRYLATPDAAAPWARAGGFVSTNLALDPSVYPDPLTRRIAVELASARTVRFDLSDLEPPSFGATPGQGLWGILQDFLANTQDVASVTHRLESAASAALACERATQGSC